MAVIHQKEKEGGGEVLTFLRATITLKAAQEHPSLLQNASCTSSSDASCLVSPKAAWGLTIYLLLYPTYPRVRWFGVQGGALLICECGKQRPKLSVALDGCDEGVSNILEALLERFSWRCMLQGLERQRESKQKEKILSNGG